MDAGYSYMRFNRRHKIAQGEQTTLKTLRRFFLITFFIFAVMPLVIVAQDNNGGIGFPSAANPTLFVPLTPNDIPLPTDLTNNDIPLPTDLTNNDIPLPTDLTNSDIPLPTDLTNNDIPLPTDLTNNDIPLPTDLTNNDI